MLGSGPEPISSTLTRAYDTVPQSRILAPDLLVQAYVTAKFAIYPRFVGWRAVTCRSCREWTAARTRANGIVSIKAAIPVKSNAVLGSTCLICENCRAYQFVVCLKRTLI